MKKAILIIAATIGMFSCTKTPKQTPNVNNKLDTILSINYTASTENLDYDTVTSNLVLDTTLYVNLNYVDSIGSKHADSVLSSWFTDSTFTPQFTAHNGIVGQAIIVHYKITSEIILGFIIKP